MATCRIDGVQMLTRDKREFLLGLCNKQHWRCFWCGEVMNDTPTSPRFRTLDHVLPKSEKTKRVEMARNMVAACDSCNQLRGQFHNTKQLGARISHLQQIIEERDKTLARHKVTMAGRCYWCKLKFHFLEWLHMRRNKEAA